MTAPTHHIHIDGPEFGPDERYRIYERRQRVDYGYSSGGRLPSHVAVGSDKVLIATCPTPAAVGIALCQMAEDRWEAGDTSTPVVGVLDGEKRRWITGLWVGGGLA